MNAPSAPTFSTPPSTIVVDHPMIQHKLTLMRRTRTPANEFRLLLREISMMMAYEVTRDMPMEMIEIETPLTTMQAPVVAGKKLCLVSVLRAGGGILEGMLEILPAARVGHVGLYRDPVSLAAVEYYLKLPRDISERTAIVLDPMLATGNSAAAAVAEVKAAGCQSIKFVSLISAPEGLATFHEAHPDVPVFTAAIDSHLNDHGYIVPGIGDAGDRIFGTK
ncbi:uracil phosphoribosyltransferase [Ancylobacter pratisalsi]|uniref:Uracil phosphoribosyltransferase n=1 Tax=Ancylobacter pratisalsi TaxID=1745854 RepID=A0A6P1YP47_9HYPH|nr:uracil phosphoribosyltransferase [Ancylobacter pratisalsi]QIB34501.1 uracil phosphoribosyltransferase [Ancylobacter pratisalsi]